MKKLMMAVMLLIFSLPLFAQSSIDDFLLLTEEYPPLNFEKDGKLQGISIEAMSEMLKIVGAKKKVQETKLWPWARSYETVLNQKNTALYVMGRTEARDKLFKWVGPVLPSRIVLIAKKSKGIKIKSVDDLNASSYKIGGVREDIGEQMLLKRGVKAEKIAEKTNSSVNAAKMLQADRIDLWSYEEIVALWKIKELGYSPNDFEEVFTLLEQQYYFAFHKDTDDKLIAKLQAAFDQLKASGKYDEIVKKYR